MRREHAVSKLFSYKKGECNLSFTLRIDKKDEMKDFEELLIEALAEVREEIAK